MRAVERGWLQLALMGRPAKRRKRPVPQARQPSAPRVAYLHGILQMVDAMHARVRQDLLPALRPIIEAHNALRPDAMQLRIDATGSRTAAEIERIRKDLERVIPVRRIALLAEQNALRVAEHSRKELNRQVRTVANIDVHADPTVLAEHVEAFVEDNVRLVKSLLTGELDDLKGIVLRGARAGLRYEDIADEIVEKFGATKRRAALFALLFAVVATASAGLAAQFGGRGLLASSALAGAFDVDVSVLGALRLDEHSVSVETVGQAVLAALAANAIGRLSLAVFAGPVRFWLPLAVTTVIAATMGICALLLLGPG